MGAADPTSVTLTGLLYLANRNQPGHTIQVPYDTSTIRYKYHKVTDQNDRERENYAEKGGNPFLHMLREWTLT